MKLPILIIVTSFALSGLTGCISVSRETPAETTTSVTTVTPSQRTTTVTQY